MELFSLKGKVAVVTGAGGLLGKEHVLALSEAGASVAACDIDKEAAVQSVFNITTPGLAFEMDISSALSVKESFKDILHYFQRIDILVNNAAIDDKFASIKQDLEISAFENYPLELWQRSLAVNLTGTFLCCQTIGSHMAQKGSGSIINIASTYGVVAPDQSIYRDKQGRQRFFKSPVYPATKGAVISLSKYLAAYWGNRGVRVNCLSPGGVENGQDDQFIERYSLKTILGRMARPKDYRGALIFLASEASAYMTGANLIVDGGWTALWVIKRGKEAIVYDQYIGATNLMTSCSAKSLTKRIHSQLTKKALAIRLVFTDVDGVLTDTGVYYNERGDALRRFSVRDGMGVERLRSILDIETVIISGEDSPSIKTRAQKLNIRECYLGIKDKVNLIRGLLSKKGLNQQEIAYIGDDLNDLEAVHEAGLSACPADAVQEMASTCDYVCLNKGGYGAFREFAELIIMLRQAKKEAKDEETKKG